ncbi:hypothetical protein [Levilactobacillus bambusae]|uniref:Beta-1,6-galactofuranosyltransferase n=1 Tax=Levilactobacillus bambusae TaxID=2024736 RepID=A0A2V1MY05_9LACO|nr:hypothetical protein [Levilactobacillus bambusae]PWF99913.1 hypothetical protein DCM90_02880 [Levilactobacillus bambusae]
MTKWVTRIIEGTSLDATTKAKADFARIAHNAAGYRYLDVHRYDRSRETMAELGARIEGMTGSIRAGDLVVYQYPSYNGNQFEVSFAEHLVYRGVQVVLMVHDYERLRHGINPGFDEIRHLNLVAGIIAPTVNMRQQMKMDGVTTPIVVQDCWDYLTDTAFKTEPVQREVVIAGSFVKSNLLSTWNQQTPLIAFGLNNGQQPAMNVEYHGALGASLLEETLPNGFGLAWDTGDDFGAYTRYNNPYKVAMYLALGMPVIVWKEAAIAQLVQDNYLGYALSSISEIDGLISSVSDSEMSRCQLQVQKFGRLLRRGYFTRRLLLNMEQILTLNPLTITK